MHDELMVGMPRERLGMSVLQVMTDTLLGTVVTSINTKNKYINK